MAGSMGEISAMSANAAKGSASIAACLRIPESARLARNISAPASTNMCVRAMFGMSRKPVPSAPMMLPTVERAKTAPAPLPSAPLADVSLMQ